MNYSKFCTAVSILIASLVLPGCSERYYTAKPITPESKFPSVIERAQKKHRYFIMRSGINLYTVTSVDIHKTKQEMTVTLDKVDSTRLVFLNSLEGKAYKPQKGEPSLHSQIRLYMVDSISYTYDEPHTISLNKISRVELVD